MALMIMIQNIHAFNCRSEKRSTFDIPLSSNWVFALGVIGSIILGVAVLEVQFLSVFLKTNHVPFNHLLVLLMVSFSILILMETYKKIKYRKRK